MKFGTTPADLRYAEVIKPIRNQLRSFRYDSVVLAISAFLNASNATDVQSLGRRKPWVAERMALWVLSDDPGCYRGKSMSLQDVQRLVDLAWRMGDELHRHTGGINHIHLFVRQQILPQGPYQQGLNPGYFGRQLHLVSDLQLNSRLKQVLDRKAGMAIEVYLELAFLYWCNAIQGNRTFSEPLLAQLQSLYGQGVADTFIGSLAKPSSVVRMLIKRERVIGVDEWFQPTLLYRYPCIWTATGVVSWGTPTLRRHFENIIADWLDDPDEDQARRDWDKRYADYVGMVLRLTGKTVIDEAAIKGLLKLTGKVCDYLVEDDGCVVLIEVKLKALNHSFPALDNPNKIKSKLKATVVKGADQLSTTRDAARQHPRFQDKTIYSLVVTSGDLFLGPGSFLYDEDATGRALAPLLFSGDQLDHLCEIIRLGQTSFGGFLGELVRRNQDPKTMVFSPSQLMLVPPYALSTTPAHLMVHFNALISAMRMRLGG